MEPDGLIAAVVVGAVPVRNAGAGPRCFSESTLGQEQRARNSNERGGGNSTAQRTTG